jgi:aryl-alcohol dehydrogenase-like predicted oxidoreductase
VETRKLGSNGPEISVVGLGGWEAGGDQWGKRADTDTVRAMHAAIDAGMNWIDTAEAYGGGRSEELVGEVLRDRRDEVLVFTKVAHFASGLRADDIRRAIGGSLKRLGTDSVDLYQIHWPAEHVVPVEEAWSTMAEIVEEGLARHIGVSNFDRALVERCLAIRRVDSVQNRLSLLAQRDRDTLLPWLAERGIGYLGYSPLAFGLLTGSITRHTRFQPDDWRSGLGDVGYYDEYFAPGVIGPLLEKVDRLRDVAARLSVPAGTLALRAVLEIPGVTGVIVGSRDERHVHDNAAAGDMRLDDATRREIDAIFLRD